MKNRGFTLIELLAVILILSLLTALAVTSVTKVVRDSKEKLYATQIKAIEEAAESWAADHLAELPESNSCIYLTVRDLQRYGVLGNNINDPRTNKAIPVTTKVKISAKGGDNVLTSYTYKVTDDVAGCDERHVLAYEPGDIIYFDVKAGKSCLELEYQNSSASVETYTYENGEYSLITTTDYLNSALYYAGNVNVTDNNTPGQANNCLMFYVLHDDGNKVTMMLDHNVSHSLWADTLSNGPVRALNSLRAVTINWNGTLTPTSYTYHRDENSCISGGVHADCEEIDYTINYTGYKARLITAEEVVTIANITTYDNSRTHTLEVGWLFDRMNPVYGNSLMPHFHIYSGTKEASLFDIAYYTATVSLDPNRIYSIRAYGSLSATLNVQEENGHDSMGIRPVIEVHKNNL